MTEAVSRAAGKLEAALARFGLTATVAGARAVDVGASTGGFTQTLLRHGAAHVVAVDVGHGQLVPELRADTRVTSMEGVDWKHLSLNEAPGPFDFFTVDVSFVAARNMLRGLAFRLRPGAEGVVPRQAGQFELADKQVRGGRVDDEKPAPRGAGQGGEKGDVARLHPRRSTRTRPWPAAAARSRSFAHLRFAGRPASLPAEGESRGSVPKPPRVRGAPETLAWFAITAPGLEEAARKEIAALPEARDVRAVEGGVEWRGPPAVGARANLWLRVATPVRVSGGVVEAREFGKLRRGLARLPWAPFVPVGATVAVRASATKSRLYHTGAIAESVMLGRLGDAVRDVSAAPKARDKTSPRVSDEPQGGRARKATSPKAASSKAAKRTRRRRPRRPSTCAPSRTDSRVQRRRLGRPASPPRRPHRGGRRAAPRDARRGRARARRLVTLGGAVRPDVRRGHDPHRGGAPRPRSRARALACVRDGALAAVRRAPRARERAARRGARAPGDAARRRRRAGRDSGLGSRSQARRTQRDATPRAPAPTPTSRSRASIWPGRARPRDDGPRRPQPALRPAARRSAPQVDLRVPRSRARLARALQPAGAPPSSWSPRARRPRRSALPVVATFPLVNGGLRVTLVVCRVV